MILKCSNCYIYFVNNIQQELHQARQVLIYLVAVSSCDNCFYHDKRPPSNIGNKRLLLKTLIVEAAISFSNSGKKLQYPIQRMENTTALCKLQSTTYPLAWIHFPHPLWMSLTIHHPHPFGRLSAQFSKVVFTAPLLCKKKD